MSAATAEFGSAAPGCSIRGTCLSISTRRATNESFGPLAPAEGQDAQHLLAARNGIRPHVTWIAEPDLLRALKLVRL